MRRSIFFSFACIGLKFCKQSPDHCRIINHGLDLNYKVRNCTCTDLSFLVLHELTCNFVGNFPDLCHIINHGLVQLCMRRSIFFSFAYIDLKSCKQPPDHCRIINHGLDLNYKVCNCACADLSFLVLHISTWNFLHSFLFVPATISQAWVYRFLSSLRSRRRYHRAQRDSNFLSVRRLSVVCLSSVCCLSVVCLSVIKLLPACGTDHYQNSYLGSLGHCEGQSRFDINSSPIPRPPTSPRKWPQNECFLFFDVLTWNFIHNLLTLEAS